MRLSFFASHLDTLPIGAELTWDELAKSFSEFRRTNCAPCAGHKCKEKFGPAWSPAEYPEGGTRARKNVVAVHALALDLDSPSMETLTALEKDLEGLEYVLHSSHSYNGESNLSLRVVVPLKTPVPAKDWGTFWAGVTSALGFPVDQACSDPSRLYFSPSAPEGGPTYYIHATGELLDPALVLSISLAPTPVVVDVGDLRAPTPVVASPPKAPVDVDDLRARLRAVQKPESQKVVKLILEGRPLPDGCHDSTLNRIAGLVAHALPISTPTDAVLGLIAQTLSTPCESHANAYEHHRIEFLDMLARARARRVERERHSLELDSAVVRAVRDRAPARTPASEEDEDPSPVVVYVMVWDKYVAKEDGVWRVEAPLSQRAAVVYLRSSGAMLEALQQVPQDSPEADAFRDMKRMPFHPLVQQVMSVDCMPGEGELFLRGSSLYLNTWVPPRIPAAPGEWDSIRALVEYVTADLNGTADPQAAKWLLHWMAAKVQNPGSPMLTAPVILGPPGSGKTSLVEILMLVLGQENCRTIGQSDLESSFNAHYANRLFVFADDCIPIGAARDLSGRLKTSITGRTTIINAKGIPQWEVANRKAWVFAANADAPIQVDADDRRYSVFANRSAVTDEWKAWGRSLWARGQHGVPTEQLRKEIGAFRYFLENLAVDFALISAPYCNAARAEIIEAGLYAPDAFAAEVAEVGFANVSEQVGGNTVCPVSRQRHAGAPEAVTAHYVFAVYRQWCDANGYKTTTANALGRRLGRHGWKKRKVPVTVYWPPERPRVIEPLTLCERVATAPVARA